MKKAEPVYSAGARYERKAIRIYLTRKLREVAIGGGACAAYQSALDWVRGRQSRYDKRAGGL